MDDAAADFALSADRHRVSVTCPMGKPKVSDPFGLAKFVEEDPYPFQVHSCDMPEPASNDPIDPDAIAGGANLPW